MANNRMYLRCDHCQKSVRLAKYYPTLTDGWFLPVFAVRQLEQFLEDHSYCPVGYPTMIGNVHFSIHCEET